MSIEKRLTKNSKLNLLAAEKCGITFIDGAGVMAFMVWVEAKGHRQVLCSADGPLVFTERAKARRSIYRHRKDLADMAAF